MPNTLIWIKNVDYGTYTYCTHIPTTYIITIPEVVIPFLITEAMKCWIKIVFITSYAIWLDSDVLRNHIAAAEMRPKQTKYSTKKWQMNMQKKIQRMLENSFFETNFMVNLAAKIVVTSTASKRLFFYISYHKCYSYFGLQCIFNAFSFRFLEPDAHFD